MKQHHLFVSQPRSGGTMLSSILNQNPSVYVALETPMLEVLLAARNTWKETPTVIANPTPVQLTNITNGIVSAMWEHKQQPIIIDRNRLWGFHMAEVKEILGDGVKVISTVRDLPSIMASWVTLYQKQKPDLTYQEKCLFSYDIWNKMTKECMDQVKQLNKDAGDRVLTIRYDDLVDNPRYHLSKIESFLGIPVYDYDLENITGEYQDKNIVPWGFKGMHRVRSNVNKISLPAKEVLGEELYQFFLDIEKDYLT